MLAGRGRLGRLGARRPAAQALVQLGNRRGLGPGAVSDRRPRRRARTSRRSPERLRALEPGQPVLVVVVTVPALAVTADRLPLPTHLSAAEWTMRPLLAPVLLSLPLAL